MRDVLTYDEWKERLNSSEMEVLDEFGLQDDIGISSDEVFEMICESLGGLRSPYQIKSIIYRVYGVEL